MDIETIIVNSITNAYTACMQLNRERKIKVTLKKKDFESREGFEICISDTGPAVDKRLENVIWEPFFTTKKNKEGSEIGTGLGLSIVESIIRELGGEKKLVKDLELKGARFEYWLPFTN